MASEEKKITQKKKKRNVLLLVALKYAENFECIYKTFHKLKIYVLMRLRDRSTCSFNFSVIFYTVILIFFHLLYFQELFIYEQTDSDKRPGTNNRNREKLF